MVYGWCAFIYLVFKSHRKSTQFGKNIYVAVIFDLFISFFFIWGVTVPARNVKIRCKNCFGYGQRLYRINFHIFTQLLWPAASEQ